MKVCQTRDDIVRILSLWSRRLAQAHSTTQSSASVHAAEAGTKLTTEYLQEQFAGCCICAGGLGQGCVDGGILHHSFSPNLGDTNQARIPSEGLLQPRCHLIRRERSFVLGKPVVISA